MKWRAEVVAQASFSWPFVGPAVQFTFSRPTEDAAAHTHRAMQKPPLRSERGFSSAAYRLVGVIASKSSSVPPFMKQSMICLPRGSRSGVSNLASSLRKKSVRIFAPAS